MYLSFYGLKEEPFRLTPDPRFLHLSKPHRAMLLALVQGVLARKGLLVATGPIGTGKTTLMRLILHILERNSAVSGRIETALLINPTLTREELLESLLDELKVSCPSTSKPARLVALQRMLLENYKRGGTVLMIVDEAHLLTPELLEEIRLLCDIDTYQAKLLQVILCGQPELEAHLFKPELRALHQRIAVFARLRELSLLETRSYISERLRAGGLLQTSPFMEASVEEIFRKTRGIPRLINLVCDRSLSLGFQSQQRQIGLALVQAAAAELSLYGNGALPDESVPRSNLPSLHSVGL